MCKFSKTYISPIFLGRHFILSISVNQELPQRLEIYDLPASAVQFVDLSIALTF
jgi:hypothetical protein